MKKYIFLGLLLFTGCGHNKLMKMYGYFYIQPNYGTYVVMLSTSDGYDSDGDVTVTNTGGYGFTEYNGNHLGSEHFCRVINRVSAVYSERISTDNNISTYCSIVNCR